MAVDFYKCNSCGEVMHADHMHYHEKSRKKNKWICSECFEDSEYEHCDLCNEILKVNSKTFSDEKFRWLCKSCESEYKKNIKLYGMVFKKGEVKSKSGIPIGLEYPTKYWGQKLTMSGWIDVEYDTVATIVGISFDKESVLIRYGEKHLNKSGRLNEYKNKKWYLLEGANLDEGVKFKYLEKYVFRSIPEMFQEDISCDKCDWSGNVWDLKMNRWNNQFCPSCGTAWCLH